MTIIEQRPPVVMVASDPFSANDLPRFGQLSEVAKDAFIKELTDFFDYTQADGLQKIEQLPNIQKFAFGSTNNNAGLETVVNLIMAYADTPDKFPMISITSSSLREKKMGLGSNFAAQIQYPPSVVGTKSGPFNMSNIIGTPTITIQTTPATDTTKTSTISFDTSLFSSTTSLSVDDLVRVINKTQALYYRFANYGGKLAIEAGGLASSSSNNSIEITAGNSQILSLLGLSIGDSGSYTSTDNPSKNRYGIAADVVINIDVITDSINTRVELSDLVYSFFAYYMQNKAFQLYGRSYFDRDVTTEWWHLSLKNQFSWSGEVNKPRQGGEQ